MTVTTVRGAGAGTGRGTRVLAWISYALAAIGGSALMSTVVGSWIGSTVGIFPPWVAALTFFGGLIGMGLDLFLDRIPNRLAVWSAILLPSIARAVHGQVGADVRDIAAAISASASAKLGVWIGQGSTLVLAGTCIFVALLMARRVVKKGGS